MRCTFTLLVLVSIAFYRLASAAVPDGELDFELNADVGWVTESATRGSLALITSCFVTMGLCIWTAVHLNIPGREEKTWRIWLRNVHWLTVGLLAPELVVYQAWRQWISAKTLQQMVNNYYQQHDAEKGPVQKKKAQIDENLNIDLNPADANSTALNGHPPVWRMEHGFYAVMGGFVFDAKTVAACGIEPAKPMTLTPRGVAILAQCGLIPPITKRDIKDKSKADGTAKALVCLQAGFMCIQAVGRKIVGLPVTLLEFNTLAHVVCAFMIYMLWWSKPWTIFEPTILQGPWTQQICSYMWMSSKVSHDNQGSDIPIVRIFKKVDGRPELERLHFSKRISETEKESPYNLQDTLNQHRSSTNGSETTLVNQNLPTIRTISPMGNILSPIFENIRQRLSPNPSSPSNNSIFHSSPLKEWMSQNLVPNEAQWRRWNLAVEAMQTFDPIGQRIKSTSPSISSSPKSISSSTTTTTIKNHPQNQTQTQHQTPLLIEELLVPRASNWPTDATMISNLPGVIMGTVLWFASMAYGAVHAAAWNDYFPSVLERYLWRVSSLYIVFSGLLWMTINFLGFTSKRFDAFWERILHGRAGTVVYVFLGVVCSVCGVAYGFARLFLVVESWISLRSMPAKSFLTPVWEPWIPHL